jgi:hypothetical protein
MHIRHQPVLTCCKLALAGVLGGVVVRLPGAATGIGARLTATAAGQALAREMYPVNSFRSQMPNVVHFGLGAAMTVDRLTIRWPSGKLQAFTNLAADRHILIDEDPAHGDGVATVVPGRPLEEVASSQ